MLKTIFTGFSPNLTARDVLISLKFLLFPWNWLKLKNGDAGKKVEQELKKYFDIDYSYLFDSGRSSLYFALKALGVKQDDEVLIQAYTCVVVPNAVKWTGGKPVYVDIDNDLNMDYADLKKKITSKSKVLIIQHTFGLPAQIDKLLSIAQEYNLKVIEDCAHSFGARYNGQFTGTFGDIGMFSFGSDKIISCVRGGALITNNFEIANKIKLLQNNLKDSLTTKIVQHLLHLPIFFISKPLYGIKIGKAMLVIFKKCNMMNKIIYNPEKVGESVSFYPAKLPNVLALILLKQLSEVDIINNHRIKIVKTYQEAGINSPWKKIKINNFNCVCLRYPILVDNPKALLQKTKKKNTLLGDWYNAVVAPINMDIDKIDYIQGSCPKAELFASQSVNLPTNRHVSESDAEKVINYCIKTNIVKDYL